MSIASQSFLSDAELLGAFDGGQVSRRGVPDTVFADALRPVANMAVAAYINATFSGAIMHTTKRGMILFFTDEAARDAYISRTET